MSNTSLEQIFNTYFSSNDSEMEARFGSKFPISRIDFNNVIQKIKSLGFKAGRGDYLLRIQNEYTDIKSGKKNISNIRTEIKHLMNIKRYCEKNSFDFENIPNFVSFMQKKRMIKPFDVNDFNFRVNLKSEIPLTKQNNLVKDTLNNWQKSKKVFRYIKRFTYTHPDYPLQIDCSIVKSSKQRGNRFIPELRIEDSNIFSNQEIHEIEIELIKGKKKKKEMYQSFRQTIKYVLSGLQKSNYPISYKEMSKVAQEYLTLLHGTNQKREITSRDFVGPSSISLEIPNIMAKKSDIPNIRNPYTVTDKADGMRKLLYISKSGNIYLLDTNMNIQFTGCVASNYFNTLIDGEHVIHDKNGNYINRYLAFDLYYEKKEDWRVFPFTYIEDLKYDIKIDTNKFRYTHLHKVIQDLKVKSVLGDEEKIPLNIVLKKFYTSTDEKVFINAATIYKSFSDGMFDYEIDGLIFTPIDKSVGSNKLGEKASPYKKTWNRSFKWKPKEYNTVDFLVTTKKNKDGTDFMGNIFQEGENTKVTTQLTQYKVLILRVGYDEKKHGYINPCEHVIQNTLPERTKHNNSYRPRPFMPPGDKEAYICNIIVDENTNGNKFMVTENKEETFQDETIVEFRYDITKDKHWRWIPIRVRHDKTAEYRKGIKNYGNAYHVALSVWKSIHNPITKDMICSGENIPDYMDEMDTYYHGSGHSKTKPMRDFHNRVVKKLLITKVSKPKNILLDLTVGKGGDIPKWIQSELSFVFGIDISRDNIENRRDGVCSRYLTSKIRNRNIFDALFVQGDSGKKIRSGESFYTDKGKEIARAIFGTGPKDEIKLGKVPYKYYGVAKNGFDIVSTQFAIHYFFENKKKLNTYLDNVSKCCKMGGYFIGTCYDGKAMFEELKEVKKGESIAALKEGKKIWDIKKQYDTDELKDDDSCIGLGIDVYQETINSYWREYLVNYDYLTQLLSSYGFIPAPREEIKGLANSIGRFRSMYEYMEKNMEERNVGLAKEMTTSEKRISFLNGYFIYKKIGERVEEKKPKEDAKEDAKKPQIKKKIIRRKKRIKKLSKETSL